jgi:DNA repair protein RecO (recombination protein O)
MFHSDEAIVLHLIRHKDNNAVVKLYTRQQGLISCFIGTIHKKTSGIRASGLQALTLLNVIIDHRENKQLATLKEAQIAFLPSGIITSVEKSSVAIFMAELISHTIREQAGDVHLYDFFRESIVQLNNTTENCANFHVIFLLNMANQLGILPHNSFTLQTPYLDLQEGTYMAHPPMHGAYLYPDESAYINKLRAIPVTGFAKAELPNSMRKNILHGLLKYFEIHAGTTPLQSHLVLETVF